MCIQFSHAPSASPQDGGAGGVGTLAAIEPDAYVLIADDFTNSGSTLLDGATIVRDSAAGGAGASLTVEAWVTHFVAKCVPPSRRPR